MRIRLGSDQTAGKGCAVAFFSVFTLMGLGFTAVLLWVLFQSARTYTWDETPCEILTSSVAEKGGQYTLDISYRYRVGGREYTSTQFRTDSQTFDKSRDAQRALKRFPAESSRTCYVNSSDPAQATLERGPLWMGFFLVIPLIFVAVGAGGIIGVLRTKPADKTAISDRHLAVKKGCGPLGVRLFGSVFILVGAGVMYAMLIGPWLKTRDAKTWKEVPCTITASRVESHRGDDSTTYSIDIHYRYEWDGQEFFGDQYNFTTGSSSSRKWKQAIVNKHRVGSHTVCYVNPADPTDSVLSRALDDDWMFGFIPGIFILAGCAVFFAAGKIGSQNPAVPTLRAATSNFTSDASGSVQLKAASTPLAGFIGMTLFALIWNGITWGIMLGAEIGTGGKLFLSIFVIIGLLVALGAVYFFLALFNPKPVITASSGSIIPSGELKIDYRFTGNARRISKLTITLEGREKATYRRGTSSATDTHLFAILPVVETADRAEIASGTARITVPADSIHTFKSSNNAIEWHLCVRGEIARWPDADIDFPIVMLPAPNTAIEIAPDANGAPAMLGDESLRIGFRDGRSAFRPGETIEGAALWEMDTAPAHVEVRLLWHTRGKGTEDGEVVATQRFDQVAAGDTRTFSLALPPAPFSFSGRLISVLWSVELVLEPSGRNVRAEITVGPDGHEIRLPEIPQPKREGFSFTRP